MMLTPAARLLVQGEFRVHDRVVAAEVAEVRPRLDGRAREPKVVEVGDAAQGRVVAAHQLDDARAVFHVNLRGPDAPVAQGLRHGARPPPVHVRDRHQLDARGVVREVVGRAESHPPRAEHEDSHPPSLRQPLPLMSALLSSPFALEEPTSEPASPTRSPTTMSISP
jgi:hypothetical protein